MNCRRSPEPQRHGRPSRLFPSCAPLSSSNRPFVMHDSIVLRSLLLPLLVAALGAGCSQEPSDNAVAIADEADASGATDLPANATPPPEIQAWMERLTVEHAYDPATGFIVAKETIALPPTLAEGPNLDDAVRQAGEDGRLVIAFATADRCAPCQQYKRDALNDARVIARLDDPSCRPDFRSRTPTQEW